ncbi:SCO family protein [Rubritalea tangerina]|uniref:SCO family protein n=2 Tax=Rubritalea tangerina TaxID=430798 RepID=A0ABW4ZDB4_9BACT
MKDKTKIIFIYSSVAVLAIGLLVLFNWMGQQRKKMAEESERKRIENLAAQVETVPMMQDLDHQLTQDLRGVNQDGEEVGLFDLKGKAIVFAQFYSRCNMCLGHNKTIMQELHEELKDNPKVHFVTVTLDPEFDTPEKLKQSAEVWNANSKSWWMLNVPKDELVRYCREQLWYIDFKENANKTSASDAITHDMGIAVIDTNSKLRAKENLFELLANDKHDLYQAKKSQLLDMIDVAIGEAGEASE